MRLRSLLLSLLLCLPVMGQVRQISSAPFTGGVLTSALSFSGTTHGGLTVLSLTTGQRDALTPTVGTIIWNVTDSRFNFYNGSSWVTMVRTTGDTMTGALALPVGTNAATSLNFGTAGTGFFSAASASDVSVAVGASRRFAFQAASFLPIGAGYNLGGSSNGWGQFYLAPVAAPSAPASGAVLYIDSADNDLKIKYSDGTVVVVGDKP